MSEKVFVQRVKAGAEGSMMDAEGRAGGNNRIEDGPLVLKDGTVLRPLCKECGDARVIAADTEGAYLALGNAVLKKAEQGRVGEILGSCLVKEPDVDVIGS
jgi:hypothetical protein